MPAQFDSSYRHSPLDDGRVLGTFAGLARIKGVVHGVTTRAWGVLPREADAGADCYARLADDLGAEAAAWVTQVHGARVFHVERPGPAGEADGLVTARESLAVVVRSADCLPILVADIDGQAVGVAHASWRGTAAGVAGQLVAAFAEHVGIPASRLVACLGPCAGPDRYEVGAEVRNAMLDAHGPDARHFFVARDGRWLFDLAAANVSQLLAAGVDFMRVYTSRVCTMTHNEHYPSYRTEGEAAGRFAAAIARVSQ
jgi:YfiH family protein